MSFPFAVFRFPGVRAIAAAVALSLPAALHAQRVLGPATDATVVPRGMLRVTAGPEWARGHERYSAGRGRVAKGEVEPFAADFNLDSLGPGQLPALAAVSAGVRSIVGGTSGLPVTLGALETRFDVSVARTPILVEYGVTRRLTIGAMFPLVKTWTEVSLQPNKSRDGSTVGLNPRGYTTNQVVVSQLQAAAQALGQLLQSCVGSTAPGCTAVNADRARAQALVQSATAAATGVESVYGTSAAKPGSRFAPADSSTLQRSIASRLGALSTDFAAFLGAPPSGTGWITARPVGATQFSWGNLQRVLTDTAYGIGADSLISVGMNRLGDVEVGGRFLLFDGLGGIPQRATPSGVRLRLAVEGVVRFGTATRDSIHHFADVGTGDGQRDLEGRVMADLLFGRRAWASVSARYTLQQADEIRQRVPGATPDPFPAASRIAVLQRDLGDAVSLEVSPRYVLSDNLGLSATWQLYRKGSDRYTGSAGPELALLESGSEQVLQRALVSVTYSTMAQYFQQKARTPMEVSLTVGRSLAGSGMMKQSVTALTVRVYNQLLEGRR
ncbi:MAG: hypothetical protein JNJ98_10620 [Gemmatimonadetes bacterium]|nr:hypothetical protein [Gemmatimonadota bacterium]